MSEIYKIIAGLDEPTVDLAMSEALSTADPISQVNLVLMLLKRGHQPALAEVIRTYHILPHELKDKLLGEMEQLEAGIRIVAAESESQAAFNLIHLIVRSRCYHLAYLLSVELQKEDHQVQRAAAAGLLDLAWGLRLGLEATNEKVASQVLAMGNALAEACSSYHKHHQHIVLMAAAALAPATPPRLIKMLSDRLSTPYAHLRQLLPRMDHPLINRALLSFAAVPNLRPIVVEALRSRASAARLSDILQAAHLTVLNPVRAAVRKVTSAEHLLPTDEHLKTMDEETLRSVPRWINIVHVESSKKAEALARVISTDNELLRLLGLRALMHNADRPTDDRVVMMCLDKNLVMARIALRHLMLRRWVGLPRLMVLLIDSEHADIRQMAERYLISSAFERLWERWDHLPVRMRVLAGVTLIRTNRNFYRQLSVKLRSRHDQDRLRAITMVRHLKIASQFRNELIRLIHDENSRVASSAVGALGPLPKPPRLKALLLGLLSHGNDRLRASAIESLQRTGDLSSARNVLHELALAGNGNRSRATATWALLCAGDRRAADRLTALLGDPRPRHRISGIWVAARIAMASQSQRLETMLESDSDPNVRKAAQEALHGTGVHEEASA